jgi:hypothetical protein
MSRQEHLVLEMVYYRELEQSQKRPCSCPHGPTVSILPRLPVELEVRHGIETGSDQLMFGLT